MTRKPPAPPPRYEGYHMPQQPTNQQPPQQRPERASNLVSGAPRRPAPEGGRPQQPQPQRQSRLVTALLFGGFALIAVLVFAVAFIAGSSPSSQVRERIAAEVKAKTGRDLTIGGETSFSFYPSVGLVLRDVTLSAPPGMGGDPTARIAALEVRVRALPLIKKQVEIEQLVLRDPVFNLRVDGQGRRSWQFAESAEPSRVRYAQAGAPRTDAPTQLPSDAKDFLDNATAGQKESAQPSNLRDFSLGDVRVENGTVRYTDDRRAGSTQVISAINAKLALASLESPLQANGDFMLEGEKVSFDGRLTSLQQLMQEKPGRLAFNVASEPLKLTYDGSVLVREFVDLSGAVEATTPSARALVDWLGSALPPAEGFGPFSVKGRLRAAGKSLALNDATIGLDGATATGNVAIETGGERPVVKARLNISELDLNKYGSDTTAPSKPAKKRAALQPPPAGAGGAALPQSIDDLLKPQTPQVRGYERRAGWSEEPINTALLSLVDADATLSIGRLLVREIKIGKTDLQINLKRSVLTTNITDVALYDGKGRGVISVDASGGTPSVSTDVTIDNVSAQPLLRDAAAMNWLAGNGNLQMKLAGQGATEKAIVESLDGSAAFQFANGAIVGVNIPQLLRGGGTTDKTDFSELSASFAIKDGIAQNNDLKIVSPLLRVGGSGQVMLGARQIDYVAKPKIVGSLAGQGGPINLAGIEVPVKIKGSWDQPSISPDLQGIIKDPSKAVDVVREIGKQLGGKKAGDLLKGLLGGRD